MAQTLQINMVRRENCPWGFRLHGGVDFGTPLTIQKVGFHVDVYRIYHRISYRKVLFTLIIEDDKTPLSFLRQLPFKFIYTGDVELAILLSDVILK